jgi:hypothetical protein
MRVILKFVDPDGRICDEVDEATKLRVAMRWTEAALYCYYPALVIPLEPAKNAVEKP